VCFSSKAQLVSTKTHLNPVPIPQRLTRVKPGFKPGFAHLFGKGYVLWML